MGAWYGPAERRVIAGAAADVYGRLSQAIQRGDKEQARRIYYDEILPDRRFSRTEVINLSYRVGAIDEGDNYLGKGSDV